MIRSLCALITIIIAAAAHAQTPPADPDFAIQGEYAGQISSADAKTKLGVQVVALSKGEFDAVFYPGGLPGDGGTKAKKEKAHGKTADALTIFKSASYAASIKDGTMTISDPAGKELGRLERVLRKSPTLGAKPPQGALVLFDGTTGDEWVHQNKKNPTIDTNLLVQGVFSKKKFQSCTLHVEFLLPFESKNRGQGRSNSGCYLQSRYEVQILDSFGLEGADNECGGIYKVGAPLANMCFPPLSWQTYDIEFTAPTWDGNKKTANARMTVKHNGVLIQNNIEIPGSTTAAPAQESPEAGPIYLQDHGHPVRFQNVWIVEKK